MLCGNLSKSVHDRSGEGSCILVGRSILLLIRNVFSIDVRTRPTIQLKSKIRLAQQAMERIMIRVTFRTGSELP